MNSKVAPGRPARIAPFMPPNVIDTSQARPHTITEESSEYGDQHNISEIDTIPTTSDPPQRLIYRYLKPRGAIKRGLPPGNRVRPFTSIAQGRKATLEALPGKPSAKAKIGSKVAAFDGLDSLDPSETQTGEFDSSPSTAKTAQSSLKSNSLTSVQHPSNETPEAVQRHHEKSLALQQLASQMAEQHSKDFSAEGCPSLGGASNENELHDMIVKIRDSPHEQPKRNLQSERVMLRGTYLFHPQEPSTCFGSSSLGLALCI
ncbi:hypothetical protein V7S43_016838 [Phytophthora oleae]|uniref:Uncharacterized protein n=1 Tax=Phytophthora oleae TaxID=2107226 RepID=A0ABD3EUS8_9STRA